MLHLEQMKIVILLSLSIIPIKIQNRGNTSILNNEKHHFHGKFQKV